MFSKICTFNIELEKFLIKIEFYLQYNVYIVCIFSIINKNCHSEIKFLSISTTRAISIT